MSNVHLTYHSFNVEDETRYNKEFQYDEIPSIFRILTNLNSSGHWVYWKKLTNGKWVYAPIWIKQEESNNYIQTLYKGEYDEPLALHISFVNMDNEGYWDYWRINNNGKYVWCPRWISITEKEMYDQLIEAEKNWLEILQEEKNTPQSERTDEWYINISGRKLTAYNVLTNIQQSLRINC